VNTPQTILTKPLFLFRYPAMFDSGQAPTYAASQLRLITVPSRETAQVACRSLGEAGGDLRVADVRRSLGGAGQINAPPESGAHCGAIFRFNFKAGNNCKTVIASAAKQSIAPRKERMDCFVAALLAMTELQIQIRLNAGI